LDEHLPAAPWFSRARRSKRCNTMPHALRPPIVWPEAADPKPFATQQRGVSVERQKLKGTGKVFGIDKI